MMLASQSFVAGATAIWRDSLSSRRMGLRELLCCLLLQLGIAFMEKHWASDEAHSCGYETSSDVTKNGTITSPNYPEPYPAKAYCIYQFVGRGKERVQIKFTDFDLHLPHEPPRDCESVDALMVFITINGQKERLGNFCGNMLPNQIMSNGPTMSVEFRSLHSSPEVKGFRATYRFVKDFGITGGRQNNDSVCAFTFRSEEGGNGTFTSPNYPGYYPRDTECHYFFKGKPKERVHITFDHFDVDGIDSCTQGTASDYVELSNFKSSAAGNIPKYCGKMKPKTVESDGSYFRVSFKSNDKFDRTGFKALYKFKHTEDPLTVKRISKTVETDSNGTQCQKRISALALVFVFLTTIIP